jgi:hypothetical protein
MSNHTMYAIYLPNDKERWFKTTFSKASRAQWFAESEGLAKNDYEIRTTEEERDVA